MYMGVIYMTFINWQSFITIKAEMIMILYGLLNAVAKIYLD